MTPAHLRKFLREIDMSDVLPEPDEVDGWADHYRRLMQGLQMAVEHLDTDHPIDRDEMSRAIQEALD